MNAQTPWPGGAVVLAGGRGRRLGGPTPKAERTLAGVRLVDRVVQAAREAGAAPIVVAGPAAVVPAGCVGVREEPPFGGPLAALAAALPALRADAARSSEPDELLLLSCDLVHPRAVLAALRMHAPRPGEDAVVLADPAGRPQWLAGRYRVRAVADAIAAMRGEVADRPLRHALGELTIRFHPAPSATVADIDTPDDLREARTTHVAEHPPAP